MSQEDTLSILPLHPKSCLRDRSGYYPNITETQSKALSELLLKIKEDGIELSSDDDIITLKLYRFLRARKFNVQYTHELLVNDIKWRKDNNVDIIRKQSLHSVIPCQPIELYKYLPTWVQGIDKQGRPIMYRQYGKQPTLFFILNCGCLT